MTASRYGEKALSSRAGQRGGAALEFALILPLLILLTYGMIVYAYIYVIQESINFAAQEAAEAAVAVDPTIQNYAEVVTTQSRASAVQVLSWMPAAQRQRVLGNNGSQVQVSISPSATTPDQNIVTVVMTFTMNTPSPLFMQLNLPFIGETPPVPNLLSATGVATL